MIKATFEATDQTVVIVGGNSGIGISLTKQLLLAGGIVHSIDIQSSATTASHEKLFYYQMDPRDIKSFKLHRIKKATGKIDGLVNLSGSITQFKSITEITKNEWDHTYDIGFKSCFNACKTFAPVMKKNSSIVNMSSGLAFAGQKNYGPYAASKAAVISLSKTLAAELAPITRVNTVAPGAVDTPFLTDPTTGEKRVDITKYKSIVPLGVIAQPEEISNVILFLLSSASTHITGQCIHVNGGAMMV